ncbi:MAG: SpoIIE family protein phosphatase [Bacteroidales bacterium]|nr:SpoIIE family protein phosphatase [Bacteroidales bacterium]
MALIFLITGHVFPQEKKYRQSEAGSYEAFIEEAQARLAAGNPEEAVRYLLKAADILEIKDDKEKLPTVYIMVADIYVTVGALENAADYYSKSLQKGIFTDTKAKAETEGKLGDVYYEMQQYSKAIDPYNEAAELYQRAGDEKSLTELLVKMALTHRKAGYFTESLRNSERLLQIAENTGRKSLRFTTLNNMGYDYVRLGAYQKAYESFIDAYDAGKGINIPADRLAELEINISVCLFNMKKPREAIGNLQELLASGKPDISSGMQAKTENLLSTIYLYTGDLYNAGQFSERAVESAQRSGDKYILQKCYNTHSQILKAGNDPISALEFYEKYLYLRDSLLLEEKLKEQQIARRKFDLEKSEKEIRLEIADENIMEMRLIQSELERERQRQQIDSLEQATRLSNLQYEAEKQTTAFERERLQREVADRTNRELKSQNRIQELVIDSTKREDRQKQLEITRLETINRQQKIVNRRTIIIVILLILVAAGISAGLITVRKKNILLAQQKHEIEEKNDHLEQLNEEITTQKEMIEEKNTAITASINYAEKIQSAVLPPDDFFRENLADYFIFFRPRDIVSGDFYWGSNKDGKLVIVAADCTGHGVPGAFMSMLGTAFLNEIVANTERPESHQILNQLRKNVIEAMRQTGEEGEAKDGMDIALCVLDYKKMKLQYSGAFNPLYYIRNDELLQIKADRMPIGIHEKVVAGFTKNELDLKPGECFYMFSDGFADQFGGPEGKKFKNKAFQELLLANHHHPMSRQKKILEEAFDSWKKGFDQIDDVLVLGVRI